MMTLLAVLAGVLGQTVDYAKADHADGWLRHAVYGDPSFDSFVRAPGNPLLTGAPPLEWPVNGFLFEDPQTGNRYVYAGLYSKDYATGEGKAMVCEVYRSTDRGGTWERLGRVFPEEPHTFRGDISPIGYAPDVSVVYADGAYHMIYDWASANSDWAHMMEPSGGADNGIAYARADKPEGPFITTPEPVYRTSAHKAYRGKYRRGYAATLVRRANDWMVLAMTDSGPNFSWAMMAMNAKSPEGPYSEPVFVRTVEDDYYHPPLMEFFPAFVHGDRVYAPATSVALNRNYQVLFSAPLEKAMDPAAWEITRLGSLWHAEDVPNEHFGIWGQTFSGYVDRDGAFQVMFPSRNPDGMGTINLASRPWGQPMRDGFVMTGHRGPSLALLRRTADAFTLEVEMTVRGTAAIVWDYDAPLGPDKPSADSTLHRLSLLQHVAWEQSDGGEKIYLVDAAGAPLVFGEHTGDYPAQRKLTLVNHGDGRVECTTEGVTRGVYDTRRGSCTAIGLYVGPDSRVEVSRFALTGDTEPAEARLLYTEAILGAGAAKDFWQEVKASESHHNYEFLFGRGAISLRPDSMAKWNFEGSGCELWSPRGSDFGKAAIWIDGEKAETVDLHADTEIQSYPCFTRTGLKGRLHTLIVRPETGVVPLDHLVVKLD